MDYQKDKIYIYIFSILILFSYFFGFYINEDAAGGGKVDLYDHEWGNVQLFINNNVLDVLGDERYESSRTPLYLIINKYNIELLEKHTIAISYQKNVFWQNVLDFPYFKYAVNSDPILHNINSLLI